MNKDELEKIKEGLDLIIGVGDRIKKVEKKADEIGNKKIDEAIEKLTKFFADERKTLNEILTSKYLSEIAKANSVDELCKKIDDLIKKNSEVREVIVKNQKEFPKEIIVKNQKEFPKEIEVKNFPNSDTPLVVKVIESLIALMKKGASVIMGNKDPEQAIPVRLVDKTGKWFYDAIFQALGGVGISTKSIEDKLDEVKTKLDTANTSIVDELADYFISDKDDDASPNYFGFLKKDGSWYILKETVSAGADTYRYCKGTSGYTDAWTGRAGLTYGYFDVIF